MHVKFSLKCIPGYLSYTTGAARRIKCVVLGKQDMGVAGTLVTIVQMPVQGGVAQHT